MSNIKIITLDGELLKESKSIELKKTIIDRINEMNLLNAKYKNNQDFLILICNLIEYLVKKQFDITKKELAIDIATEIFNLSEEEQNLVRNNIDIIHLKKLIKPVSYYKLFKCSMKEFFFKKSTKSA